MEPPAGAADAGGGGRAPEVLKGDIQRKDEGSQELGRVQEGQES